MFECNNSTFLERHLSQAHIILVSLSSGSIVATALDCDIEMLLIEPLRGMAGRVRLERCISNHRQRTAQYKY